MKLEALINLKLASRADLVVNGRLNFGLEYYVLNNDKSTLSGKHTITTFTHAEELNSWYKQKRVFILESCLDAPIKILNTIAE